MKASRLISLALFTSAVAGQDVLNSLLSEAGSIFTVVTSAIGNTNTATTSSSAVTASSTSSSSSDSSTATSSSATSSATAAASSSISTASSTASNAAQSATATPAASSSGGGSSDILPIVLGCTLGALALAAFLALLFFCRRRRRRSNTAAKHRPLSPSDEEVESWRHEKPRVRSFKGPVEHTTLVEPHASGAPVINGYTNNTHPHEQHQNPFAPVPPPARRSNSRAGLHGPAYYSTRPYSADDYHPQNDHSSNGLHGEGSAHHNDHHTAAAGVGGLALGGLAAHALDGHERRRSESRGREIVDEKRDPTFSEDERNTLPQTAHRTSGSVSRASVKEPWPFMDAHERRSTDSGRSRARSLSRSQEYFATPDQHPSHALALPSAAGTAGAAALGGLAGAAVARKSGSKSPHRKGILKQTTSDSSDPVSTSSESRSFDSFPGADRKDFASGPHELAATDYPPTPTARERRNSALGTAAPAAAVGSYVINEVPERPRHGRGGSGSSTSLPMPLPPITVPTASQRNSIDSTAPAVPSRSPRRMSINPNARYSTATEGTAEMPAHSMEKDLVSPSLQPQRLNEHESIVSPVSPINDSQLGSWSRAQAEEFGMTAPRVEAAAGVGRNLSQQSTAVESPENASDGSSGQPSGLVSAIQRIFNSQKSAWADEENANSHGFYRSLPIGGTQYEHTKPIQSVPHRKAAPNRSSPQHSSQYGDVDRTSTGADVMPGAWQQTSPDLRHSGESARSFPSQYRSRGNGFTNANTDSTGPANPTANQTRPRSRSRSGYGLGSGDPFDLVNMRTDSNMTGISLSHYQTPSTLSTDPNVQPAHQRPAFSKRDSSSPEYKEPTLAELRQQVAAEDNQRVRRQRRHSRNNSEGLRYGDDSELFNLAVPGQEGPMYEREMFYDQATVKGSSMEQQRARRGSGRSVGWAY